MAGHRDWPQHTKSRVPGHSSHREGDSAPQNQKGSSFTCDILNADLYVITPGIELKDAPWLTGRWQPALHHGLPEGELAEAWSLGSEFGEPAPRLPPLQHRAGPRTQLRRHRGEDVHQAPGPPGTLTQYGKSERHQLETAVQHYRVQTEELPWQRSRRGHHRLKRFIRPHMGRTKLQTL